VHVTFLRESLMWHIQKISTVIYSEVFIIKLSQGYVGVVIIRHIAIT